MPASRGRIGWDWGRGLSSPPRGLSLWLSWASQDRQLGFEEHPKSQCSQRTSPTGQCSACVVLATVPLAKASHMVESKVIVSGGDSQGCDYQEGWCIGDHQSDGLPKHGVPSLTGDHTHICINPDVTVPSSDSNIEYIGSAVGTKKHQKTEAETR